MSSEADSLTYETKVQQIDFVSPSGISRCFSCFAIGGSLEGDIIVLKQYLGQ